MQARDLVAHDAPSRDFGRLLRHWRLARRFSQLDLAGEASVSSRHLCFLENGRAQPSRDMVQILGTALDLPLEAQNELHLAADSFRRSATRDGPPSTSSTCATPSISS